MFDSFNNDIVIHFASYLHSQDLVSLSLTCRRFGGKNNNSLSLMEDTAHQIISNAQQDEERDALPRKADQSYIELYSELEKYREPWVFDQLIGQSISYYANDKSHIKYNGEKVVSNTAICNHVMRAGKHYATFTFTTGSTDDDVFFSMPGITRPLKNWDKKGLTCFDPTDRGYFDELQKERTERWGDGNINYCGMLIEYGPGRCFWTSWQGGANSGEFVGSVGNEWFSTGDVVGLLLDLDVGTLCVYKNGRRICVIKDGLSGEYCWCGVISSGQVRIEKGPIPTSIVGESLGFILNNSYVKISGDEQGRTFGDVAKGVASKRGEQRDGLVVFDGDLFGKEIGWDKKNIASNLGRLKKKGSDKKSRRIDNGKPGQYPQFWYVDGLRRGLDDYTVFTLS